MGSDGVSADRPGAPHGSPRAERSDAGAYRDALAAAIRAMARMVCASCSYAVAMSCYNQHVNEMECDSVRYRDVLQAMGYDYLTALEADCAAKEVAAVMTIACQRGEHKRCPDSTDCPCPCHAALSTVAPASPSSTSSDRGVAPEAGDTRG